MQKGVAIYLRCEGANDHHNTVLNDAAIPMLNTGGKLSYGHVNFLVEDIDEIMVGKMYMERKGWPKSPIGLGRHRIGSGAFLYLPAPTGGEIEYGADIDVIDDTWIPHSWNVTFGFMIFAHNVPPELEDSMKWEMDVIDRDTVRHTPFAEAEVNVDRIPQ
jgi:hypothetical protein